MSDFLLGLFGQNAEQQARNDIGDYDPKKGKIERDEIEQFFDNLVWQKWQDTRRRVKVNILIR